MAKGVIDDGNDGVSTEGGDGCWRAVRSGDGVWACLIG